MHEANPLRSLLMRGLLLALSATLIFAAPAARAQDGGNEKLPPTVQDNTFSQIIEQRGLVRQAVQNGELRVIVSLQSTYIPEGQLLGPNETVQTSAAVNIQRQSINNLKTQTIANLQTFPGFSLNSQLKTLPHFVATVDASSLAAITRLSTVRSVQEDIARPLNMTHSTRYVNASGPDGTWNLGLDGSNFAVAIMDTGGFSDHTFLNGKLAFEACFSDPFGFGETTACANGETRVFGGTGTSSPFNQCVGYSNAFGAIPTGDCSHGTHVAGTAGGRLATYSDSSISEQGDTTTMGGVAHDADILSFQVGTMFDSCAGRLVPCILTYDSTLIDAMTYIYNSLASVNGGAFNVASINFSFGGGPYYTGFCDAQNPAMRDAINQLRSIDIAFVTSSGNGGATNSMSFPGCIENSVSVGSVDINHAVGTARSPFQITPNWPDPASFSGYHGSGVEQISPFTDAGPQLDLLAPGSDIESSIVTTSPSNTTTFALFDGTSMAAPHVAGAWTIMKQQSPVASVDRILTTLQQSGVQLTDVSYFGNGFSNGEVVARLYRSGAPGRSYPRIDLNAAVRFYGQDFGDAPVSYAPTGTPATHLIVPEYYLGSQVNADAEQTVSPSSLDNDGVQIPVLARGNSAEFGLTASVAYAAGMPEDYLGRLNAWIDFNADGDFEDAGEHVVQELPLTGPYPQAIPVEIPADAAIGETYARFRYSTQPNIGPNGLAYNGEVEDYRVFITATNEVAAAVAE